MPDLVQAFGRALRMQPGGGKTASLVVPCSSGRAKLRTTCSRAHDARVVEALAQPQAQGRIKGVQSRSGE